MANLSPEALAKIAAALPDDVNPDEFGTQYQALQGAQAEADKLRQLDEWFRNDYQPWFQTYGGDFAEFQRYKQNGNKLTETPPVPAPAGTRNADTIDYESPDALKEAVSYLSTRLEDVQHTVDDRLKLVDATIESRSQEMQRLLALQEQAYGLINDETYREIASLKNQPDWRPSVDIPKLVTYAQQNNIPDLRRAHQAYSQSDREKEIERRGYERGREEAQRAAASQSVTTELSGGGTPFKHTQPADRKPGNAGREEILQQIHNRWAQRRAQQ